jgi:hypothetical protein
MSVPSTTADGRRFARWYDGHVTAAETLIAGRSSFEQQAWAEAYAQFSAADKEARLEPEDLGHFAVAARLIGRTPTRTGCTSEATRSWSREAIRGRPRTSRSGSA